MADPMAEDQSKESDLLFLKLKILLSPADVIIDFHYL